MFWQVCQIDTKLSEFDEKFVKLIFTSLTPSRWWVRLANVLTLGQSSLWWWIINHHNHHNHHHHHHHHHTNNNYHNHDQKGNIQSSTCDFHPCRLSRSSATCPSPTRTSTWWSFEEDEEDDDDDDDGDDGADDGADNDSNDDDDDDTRGQDAAQ